MRSDPITGTPSSPPVMPMGDGGSISTFTSLSGTSLLLTNVAVSVASAGFAVLRTQVAPRISMSPVDMLAPLPTAWLACMEV